MDMPAVSQQDRLYVLVIGAGWLGLLVGVATALPWPLTDWRVAVALGGLSSFAAYGLHRYERVRLGLVQEADS